MGLSKTLHCQLLDPDLVVRTSEEYAKFINKLDISIPERRHVYRYLLEKAVADIKAQKDIIWAQPWRRISGIETTVKNLCCKTSRSELSYDIDLETILKNGWFKTYVIECLTNLIDTKMRIKQRYLSGSHSWSGEEIDDYISKHEQFSLPIPYLKIVGTNNISENVTTITNFIN